MKDHTFSVDFVFGIVILNCLNNEVRLTIEEPFSGDSETGIGSECSAYLKEDQLLELKRAIEVILSSGKE